MFKMKPVYKLLSGHVVGARPISNGPIRANMKRGFVSCVTVHCRSAYYKPSRKAKQLNFTQNFSVRTLKSFDLQSKLT